MKYSNHKIKYIGK